MPSALSQLAHCCTKALISREQKRGGDRPLSFQIQLTQMLSPTELWPWQPRYQR